MSRIVAVEAVSSMVIHSIGTELNNILGELNEQLEQVGLRDNLTVFNLLQSWKKTLSIGYNKVRDGVTHIKAGVQEQHLSSTDLHDELRKSIATWRPFVVNNECDVSLDLQARQCTGDISPYAFREIVLVLLSNASQAGSNKITIATYNSNNVDNGKISLDRAFCMTVTDNGTGIPQDKWEMVFEPHYTTKPNLGTGLGLFISRRLARMTGGDLSIDQSDSPGGTTFKLILLAK